MYESSACGISLREQSHFIILKCIYRELLQLSNPFLGKEAELFKKLPNGRVKCTACARY
jgi:hypothetical protein